MLAEQLLDFENGKIAVDEQFITLPNNLCIFTVTTNELSCKVFLDIAQNQKEAEWLSKRAQQAKRICSNSSILS